MADPRPPSSSPSPGAPSRSVAGLPHHTVHYYLALAGFVFAVIDCILNLWAYYNEGLLLTQVAFAAVVLTAAILFATWFWGVFLLMSGLILQRRVIHLLFHATLGSISPLLYTISIGLQMNTLGSQPVGSTEVEVELAAVLVVALQLVSGWLMVQRWPWRRGARRSS